MIRLLDEENSNILGFGFTVDEYHQRLVETEGLQLADLEASNQSEESGFSLLKYVSTPEEDSPARMLERSELERLVATAIDRIPKSERTVLSLYYHEELNLREIASVMDLHLSRISQLKTQAILRLRSSIEARWPGRREI